jgi:hypothetical protein
MFLDPGRVAAKQSLLETPAGKAKDWLDNQRTGRENSKFPFTFTESSLAFTEFRAFAILIFL